MTSQSLNTIHKTNTATTKKQYEKQLISYEEQRNALRKTLHRQSHVLSFSIENVNEHISFSRRWFATAYNELCFAKKIIEIV